MTRSVNRTNLNKLCEELRTAYDFDQRCIVSCIGGVCGRLLGKIADTSYNSNTMEFLSISNFDASRVTSRCFLRNPESTIEAITSLKDFFVDHRDNHGELWSTSFSQGNIVSTSQSHEGCTPSEDGEMGEEKFVVTTRTGDIFIMSKDQMNNTTTSVVKVHRLGPQLREITEWVE